MELQKQPGCWLRSSHTFKECVIAHWSSDSAPKMSGAKRDTEALDVRKHVVEEHCVRAEAALRRAVDCTQERMPV